MLLLSLVSVIETFQDELMTGAASGVVVVRSLVLMLLLSTLTALRYNNGYAVELLDDVVRLLSLSDDVVRLLSLSDDVVRLLSLSDDFVRLLSLSDDFVRLLSLSDDVVRLLSLSDDVVRLYSALTAAAASGTAVVGAVVALMMFFTLLQVFRLCPVLVGCI